MRTNPDPLIVMTVEAMSRGRTSMAVSKPAMRLAEFWLSKCCWSLCVII